MPEQNYTTRRIVNRADREAAKDKDDLVFGTTKFAASGFSVSVWDMVKQNDVQQNEVEVLESLDDKQSMNTLFNLFTKTVNHAPIATSTPIDNEVIVDGRVESSEQESDVRTTTSHVVVQPDVQPQTDAQADLPVFEGKAPVVEQLSFDVIPEAPAAESVEKAKGVRRLDPELAKKIRLVNKALSFSTLFNEEEAPIPEDAKAKQKKLPSADVAREALAELLGMKQQDGIDAVLGALDSDQIATPASDSPSI